MSYTNGGMDRLVFYTAFILSRPRHAVVSKDAPETRAAGPCVLRLGPPGRLSMRPEVECVTVCRRWY